MAHPAPRHDTRGLHERAISAAMEILQDGQTCAPCLDEVAHRVSVPPDQLRQMFPDERALIIASIEQALVRLMDACTRAVVLVDPDDPVAQFVALGDAYLDWADTYPAQFRLCLDCQLVDAMQVPVLRRYVDSVTDLMGRMLTRARDGGLLHPNEDIDMLSLSSLCYVNGVARVVVDKRMSEWVPGRDPLTAAKMLTRDFVRRMARSSAPSLRSSGRNAAV